MEQAEGKLSGQVEPGSTSENSSNSVNGVVSVSQTVILVNPEERDTVTVSKENEGLEVMGSDEKSEMGSEFGSNKVLVDGHEQVMNREMIDRRGSGDVSGQVDQGTSENSSNSVYGVVFETVVVINSDETLCVSGDNGGLDAEVNELGSSKVSMKEVKKRVSELEKKSCVIDVKCGSGKGFVENQEGERVCRICHLTSEQSSDAMMAVTSNASTTATVTDLIPLGCGCKDELGIAHGYCAEAWFRLRGNRLCEICGETAKNITGVGDDNRFMEEWNERLTVGSRNSSDRSGGCWRGQPFCNFLMACLVIAFVLPWFFRVNMF